MNSRPVMLLPFRSSSAAKTPTFRQMASAVSLLSPVITITCNMQRQYPMKISDRLRTSNKQHEMTTLAEQGASNRTELLHSLPQRLHVTSACDLTMRLTCLCSYDLTCTAGFHAHLSNRNTHKLAPDVRVFKSHTLMPASWQSLTASLTSGLGGSSNPAKPSSVRSLSIAT